MTVPASRIDCYADTARAPRVGLALGAGSAAAMAEIGAIEELERAGIEIACVAGTSAGAIVGAAYSAGRLGELRNALESLSRRAVVRLFDPVWPRTGLLEGRRALEWLRPHFGESFDDLVRDFAAVTTDLSTGQQVTLRSGSVFDALRASIAFPGVFTPWRVDGRLLVDGGLVNPVPVSEVRKIGADVVIALNVLPSHASSAAPGPTASSPRESAITECLTLSQPRTSSRAGETEPSEPSLIEVLARSSRIVAAQVAYHRLRAESPDYLIQLPVPEVGMFDLHRTAELIEIGRQHARSLMPSILELCRGSADSTPIDLVCARRALLSARQAAFA